MKKIKESIRISLLSYAFPRSAKGIENHFHSWQDEKSLIQANHITEKTMGKPGLHLQQNHDILEKINLASKESGYGMLREFSESLGY